MDFKDKEAFDKYDKKHKMRASTKVNIGGKETTVGQAIDVGGPAHPNVPKKKKGAPKPGSSASPDDVMNATLGGEKIGDIIDNEDHPNYDKAMKYVLSFDPDDEKVVSGPGKGGKPDSISASDWKKMDADEREYHTSGQYDKDAEGDDTGKYDVPYTDDEEGAGGGYDDIEGGPTPESDWTSDQVMNATLGGEKVGDIIDNEDHPNYDKAMDYVTSFDPDAEKVVSGPGKGGGTKSKKAADIYAKSKDYDNVGDLIKMGRSHEMWNMMKEVDDQRELSEEASEEIDDLITKLYDMEEGEDDSPEGMSTTDYVKMEKSVRAKIFKALKDPKNYGGKNESVTESVKRRRFTVKEVQKWMKTLEENRYKRVYNSDCRRVSWMANNMNEDVTNMPISMRKKWTKAQYGRERYLAKEFLKSKNDNARLRESIRKIVAGLDND